MNIRVAKKHLPTYIFLLAVLTAWALFHIWTRHMVTELGYSISQQQSVKQRLLTENNALCLEISTLKSSKRLEVIAKNDLDLHSPKPDQVVYLWLDE